MLKSPALVPKTELNFLSGQFNRCHSRLALRRGGEFADAHFNSFQTEIWTSKSDFENKFAKLQPHYSQPPEPTTTANSITDKRDGVIRYLRSPSRVAPHSQKSSQQGALVKIRVFVLLAHQKKKVCQ